MAKLSELIGKTMASVKNVDDGAIVFTTESGEVYELSHLQECCESVAIEDIVGDLADLVGSPILRAEETTSYDDPVGITKKHYGRYTWTFYKFATRKGYVDIRWYGESNDNYSESVDFNKVRSEAK